MLEVRVSIVNLTNWGAESLDRYIASTEIIQNLINEAMAKGYELWARVKPASSERKAQSMENVLLRDCGYDWNKRQNGGDGIRLVIIHSKYFPVSDWIKPHA